MTETTAVHPAMQMQPGPPLDAMIDEICLGIKPRYGVASRRWSFDTETAQILFIPLREANDWTCQFHSNGKWSVQLPDGQTYAEAPNPVTAMLRACLRHHLERQAKEQAFQMADTVVDPVNGPQKKKVP